MLRSFTVLFTSLGIATLARADAVTPSEATVFRHHLTKTKSATLILAAQSSIYAEPGPEWKARLRRSAATKSEGIREAVEDFIVKNEPGFSFAGLKLPPLRLVVVPAPKLREIFSDNASGWDHFRKEFGTSGLHSLSRVGFSRDGRTAIYFAYVQRDWTDGGGQFYVVRRKADEWTDSDESIGWSLVS
jgi:hypothetical protein